MYWVHIYLDSKLSYNSDFKEKLVTICSKISNNAITNLLLFAIRISRFVSPSNSFFLSFLWFNGDYSNHVSRIFIRAAILITIKAIIARRCRSWGLGLTLQVQVIVNPLVYVSWFVITSLYQLARYGFLFTLLKKIRLGQFILGQYQHEQTYNKNTPLT